VLSLNSVVSLGLALDGRDLHVRVALTVARLPAVALLGPELVDVELEAFNHRLDDLSGDAGARDIGLTESNLAFAVAGHQDVVESDCVAGFGFAALEQVDEDLLSFADFPLPAAFFDDRVHDSSRFAASVSGRSLTPDLALVPADFGPQV
jgi:hypothetical protein